MGFFDFITFKDSFYCICCQKHKNQSMGTHIHKKLGICTDCLKFLKEFPLAPVPTKTKHYTTVVSVLPYNETLKKAIHSYKFNNNPGYSHIFADMIITYLQKFDDKYKNKFLPMFDLIVPVPLSAQRLRERGYNQSTLISKKIAEHFSIAHSEKALTKIRHTKQQSLVPHNLRYKNVLDAYKADEKIVNGKRILLFDDIFTTGGTSDSCAKALLDAKAENVSILTLANRPMYMHTREYYNLLNMV